MILTMTTYVYMTPLEDAGGVRSMAYLQNVALISLSYQRLARQTGVASGIPQCILVAN